MAYRYLGNKARLVDTIVDAVGSVVKPGATVADLMCGTATVADSLAQAGYRVVAGDELTFPVRHARVRLLIDREPPFEALGGYASALGLLNDASLIEGFFQREYSDGGRPRNGCKPRMYFSAENACRIDAVRALLADWRGLGLVTPLEDDLLTHDLILAANRVANIAGTYGYYRSSWNKAALEPLALRPSVVDSRPGDHAVVQGRVEDLASEIEADVLYLDPPYTKRQYAGNYHILETLAVGDEFDPVGEGGLRDWYDQYSSFCSKRLVRDAFRTVMEDNRARWVLLSYSEDGLVPAPELSELLAGFGRVTRETVAIPRFRSNGGRTSAVTEHLYLVDTGAAARTSRRAPAVRGRRAGERPRARDSARRRSLEEQGTR
jgi:adenine-specific DNA-methyltransferase